MCEHTDKVEEDVQNCNEYIENIDGEIQNKIQEEIPTAVQEAIQAGLFNQVLSASRTRASRLAGDLREYDLHAFCPDDPGRPVEKGEILVTYGKLHKGFEYPLIKFVVITESDMFGVEKRQKKRKKYNWKILKIFLCDLERFS